MDEPEKTHNIEEKFKTLKCPSCGWLLSSKSIKCPHCQANILNAKTPEEAAEGSMTGFVNVPLLEKLTENSLVDIFIDELRKDYQGTGNYLKILKNAESERIAVLKKKEKYTIDKIMCSKCYTMNRQDEQLCSTCGKPLKTLARKKLKKADIKQNKTTRKMSQKCPQCKKRVPLQEDVCPYCFKDLN